VTNVTDRLRDGVSTNESSIPPISRRAVVGGLVGVGIAAASPAFATAPAILTGAGNFRALTLVNNRTAERLNTVYWVEGSYIPEALKAFDFILRDWRQEEIKHIDPRAIDIMAATHNLLETTEPFEIVSGYRTAATNAMLRRRSRGVARNSYHIKAMAIDITLKSRSIHEITAAALSLGAGGVGRYSRSRFTHIDSGPVRHWGR